MRFAIGNSGSFLDAVKGGLFGAALDKGLGGGALGAAGLYDPMKGLVGTSIDNGLGLGAIGSLIGSGGRGRGRRKELDNNTWLNQTYENLLGREVGEEGAAYWGGELDGGTSRDEVRDNIMQSDEYWLNRTFNELLGRNVGDEGRTYWGDELKGGVTRDSVRDNIIKSDEYREYQDYGTGRGRGKPVPFPDFPRGEGKPVPFPGFPIGGLVGGFLGS